MSTLIEVLESLFTPSLLQLELLILISSWIGIQKENLFKSFNFHWKVMKFFKSKSIFDTFKFSYYCNKLTGVLFFTLKQSKHGHFHIKTTFLDFLIFLFNLIFTSNELRKAFMIRVETNKSVVIEITDKLDCIMSVLRSVLVIFSNFIHKKVLWKIICNFNFIDLQVKTFKVQICLDTSSLVLSSLSLFFPKVQPANKFFSI